MMAILEAAPAERSAIRRYTSGRSSASFARALRVPRSTDDAAPRVAEEEEEPGAWNVDASRCTSWISVTRRSAEERGARLWAGAHAFGAQSLA